VTFGPHFRSIPAVRRLPPTPETRRVAGITFDHVTKRFGKVVAVRDLTLEIADQEFLVFLGPSGCGKSTALRMIAGLEDPTEGTISIGDEVVNEVEPRDRDVAMVFQTYALYPHMTVRRNIEFPLKSRKVPPTERTRLVAAAAETLGLGDLLDRKPAQLSGGQRQRVALARAIVRRPQAFLMDEPLSNLDAKLRVQTRADLIELQERLTATVVYVTHDQVEAMTMGHRIAIIADGALQQIGPPQEVYERPANLFVAGFIGTPPMNIIHARLVREGDGLAVSLPSARVPLPRALADAVAARSLDEVAVGVRPEHLLLAADGFVPATVTVVESLGHERNIACRLDDGTLVITRQDMDAPRPAVGESVRLTTEPQYLHVFDAHRGDRVDAI
jgi:multiple sugar transport system ATP-binding protein